LTDVNAAILLIFVSKRPRRRHILMILCRAIYVIFLSYLSSSRGLVVKGISVLGRKGS